jgi:pimeloyl-ACP methyl ester carboxylesterase
MRFHTGFSSLLLLLILLISANFVGAQQSTFEEADCPFKEPSGITLDCGYLTVPENYAEPNGTQIRLAVAIARHPSGNPEPDPIVYLEGGPGGSPLEFLYLTFNTQYQALFETNRDIVIFDQRGIGYSEPALDCPEMQALNIELLDYELDGATLTQDELDTLLVDSLMACGETLSVDNDLSAYNSASNAADVESLRMALGYEQINLWGISYGTRLALTIMRDYPDGIRSVVIDSVYTPDVNLFSASPENLHRAFKRQYGNDDTNSILRYTYE